MADKKVISRSNLPSKIPLTSTLLIFVTLKTYDATELIYGIILTLWTIYLIIHFIVFFKQKEVDIFEKEKTIDEKTEDIIDSEKQVNKFQTKLNKMVN